eukprot:TRINITY_DN26880_c0_g1_i2.p1 TRINITY_DN26880_c0_g1~~TRINITY_DN26880_c0_g1_i2.p1  ORF type:complete len:503 (+),score=65.71 TRINITY_DN26880_c0_g1_i2:8-1516(+)
MPVMGEWKVVFPKGVGYRNSACFTDRRPGKGPDCGALVKGTIVPGSDPEGIQYLQETKTKLYIPISLANGTVILQHVPSTRPLLVVTCVCCTIFYLLGALLLTEAWAQHVTNSSKFCNNAACVPQWQLDVLQRIYPILDGSSAFRGLFNPSQGNLIRVSMAHRLGRPIHIFPHQLEFSVPGEPVISQPDNNYLDRVWGGASGSKFHNKGGANGSKLHREIREICTGNTSLASLPRVSDAPIQLFNQLLPASLLRPIHKAFSSPTTAYFARNQYGASGFFGHWVPWELEPRNAVEQAIKEFMWPKAAEMFLKESGMATPVGVEWWVHSRTAGSTAHALHFDYDEEARRYESSGVHEMRHPAVSSIMYLEEGSLGGLTVVANISKRDLVPLQSHTGWLVQPETNTFGVFPGDLLHGVLPNITAQEVNQEPVPRVTLLVGFWSRDCTATTFTVGGCSRDTDEWQDLPLAVAELEEVQSAKGAVLQVDELWAEPESELSEYPKSEL